MGLDLIVEARAKPGHEAEWQAILERSFAEQERNGDVERFHEISQPAYESLNAPIVGRDPAADAWLIDRHKPDTPAKAEALLQEMRGYHVVALVVSDGVPFYSHGGLYDGVDATSFRGSFLEVCDGVLSKNLIEQAWSHKMPQVAAAYGRLLLAAALVPAQPTPARRAGLLQRFGLARPREELPIDEQRNIVVTAGRWHVFWGERGHAIRAWC